MIKDRIERVKEINILWIKPLRPPAHRAYAPEG